MRFKKEVYAFLFFDFLCLYLISCPYKNPQGLENLPEQPIPVQAVKGIHSRENQPGLMANNRPTPESIPLYKGEGKIIKAAPIRNPYAERLHSFIERGHLLEVASPADAQKQLGRPLKKVEKKIANKHDQTMDEWLTYQYNGIALTFYHAVKSNRIFLFRIEITGTKRQVMYDLKIGRAKQLVLDELGEPGEAEQQPGADSLEYFDMDEDYLPGLVRFSFLNGLITKIVWIYPLD